MNVVRDEALAQWAASDPQVAGQIGGRVLAREAGWSEGLVAALDLMRREGMGQGPDDLASIPFHSLCNGLFLPLSGLAQERATALFGFQCAMAPRSTEREELIIQFLRREDLGLDRRTRLSILLGDPFRGRPGAMARDTVLRVLGLVHLGAKRTLLGRLAALGEVAAVVAEVTPQLRSDPPLSAAEVMTTLRATVDLRRADRLRVAASLLARCGRMEAFFLARLLQRKAGLGFEYQGPLVARALAAVFDAEPDAVAHALALTDAWRVVDLLERRGPVGLNEVRLAPLVPLHPALAGGHTDDLKHFPVWAERKYDGVRLMLHKSTDERGTVMCGAYTRNRRDWMETVPGLEASIRALPCRGAIVDGELFGHVVDGHGVRPATVYEVFQMLQGEARRPVRLRFASFDLVWVDGHDLTSSPWRVRRAALERLVRPVTTLPLTVPLTVAEGQMATRVDDLNRLYQHFRSQGHEGLITKDPEGTYRLAGRDPEWRKRKPEVTLDLALLGAIFAVTQKERVGLFGSYVLGARTPEGAFVDVGDVAGLDRARDAQIQADIAREGLLTGRRIERQGVAGVATGLDLRPHIVVTVRFEGLVAPSEEGGLPHLRDPKIVAIRADKPVGECDTTRDLEDLMTRQRWA